MIKRLCSWAVVALAVTTALTIPLHATSEAVYSFVKPPYQLEYVRYDTQDFHDSYSLSFYQVNGSSRNYDLGTFITIPYSFELNDEQIDTTMMYTEIDTSIQGGTSVFEGSYLNHVELDFSNTFLTKLGTPFLGYFDVWFAIHYMPLAQRNDFYNDNTEATTVNLRTYDYDYTGVGSLMDFGKMVAPEHIATIRNNDDYVITEVYHYYFSPFVTQYIGDNNLVQSDGTVKPLSYTRFDFKPHWMAIVPPVFDAIGFSIIDAYSAVSPVYFYGFGQDINWSNVVQSIPQIGSDGIPTIDDATKKVIDTIGNLYPVALILIPVGYVGFTWIIIRYLLHKGG